MIEWCHKRLRLDRAEKMFTFSNSRRWNRRTWIAWIIWKQIFFLNEPQKNTIQNVTEQDDILESVVIMTMCLLPWSWKYNCFLCNKKNPCPEVMRLSGCDARYAQKDNQGNKRKYSPSYPAPGWKKITVSPRGSEQMEETRGGMSWWFSFKSKLFVLQLFI